MKNSIIYILFVLTATLVLLNRYTPLYINNSVLHFIVLFIAASSFVIIVGHLLGKLKSNKSILLTFLIIGILCFGKAFFTWEGDWKTQTVVYKNMQNGNNTIEQQLKASRFAFGYRKRIIERLKVMPLIDWTTDIDTSNLDQTKWQKVDLNINEMNLPQSNFE
ncbi:hypothetical protein ACRASX_12620 [Flavobacterium sp. TMP13]|uniref:hypothetical protein n=1 Tax=unclassified Flavobacterium TaxID=196869 RepID=UPI00076CA3AD|nr:hypothetical protein [Flavobacterium sp. TAB 87]KVV14808.1 hypothetical protein AP058_01864 [Flavobacterium sp. TAB 87]